MRFLLLNQFYPPDGAPTGWMLHDLGKALVARGHDVRVVCSRLGYDGSDRRNGSEVTDGVEVVRTGGIRFRRATVAGRILAYGAFLAGALHAAVRGRAPDTVVSLTTPPFIGLAGALVAKLRSSRHVHWTMDVYPDALRAHWRAAGNRLLWAGLEWLGRMQYRGAALVVTPGTCVEERLRRYVPTTVALRSIPLWSTCGADRADPAAAERERASRGWDTRELVLMYSGNMGRGHRFAEFLEAARRLGRTGPRWVFLGDGPRRHEIETFRADNPATRIEVLPSVETTRLAQSLAAADVHLISMAPGWEGIIVPSKVQNVFAVGRPVIFVGPAATEVTAWVRESGGGWAVRPDDVDALLQAIEEARDPAERHRRGNAAREYAKVHFDRDRNCRRVADLLEAGSTPS